MNHLRIIDGMSIVRARLEKDPGGLLFRILCNEQALAKDARIWVWDGLGNIKTRQAIYPRYKIDRPPATGAIWEGIKLFKDALKHTPVVQITVPGCEADDVIAFLADKYAGQIPITVETRDYDLYQLARPGVTMTGATDRGIPANEIQLYKTWVGDASDKVAGVKGFGKDSWPAITNKRLLREITSLCCQQLKPTEEQLAGAGVPKRCRKWIQENPAEILAMWTVVGFIKPTQAQVDQHTVAGRYDPAALDALLTRFML